MRKLILLVFSFSLLYSVFFFTSVFAQEDGIGQSRLNAASPLYFLKSVREALELKFAGTRHVTAIRKLEFATRRIREVRSLVQTSRQDLIQPTLENYWSQLQDFDALANLEDEDMVKQVSGAVAVQMDILQKTYNQVSDARAKRAIRATVNRLSQWEQILANKLNLVKQPDLVLGVAKSKLSGCNFLAREASSSALTEAEQEVFKERAQTCLEPKP